MMSAAIHPNRAAKAKIKVDHLSDKHLGVDTHTVKISADGCEITAFMTVEQIEDLGNACLDYVRDYNAAAMIETVERVEKGAA